MKNYIGVLAVGLIAKISWMNGIMQLQLSKELGIWT